MLTDLAQEFSAHATPLIDAQFHADLADLYIGTRREPTLGRQALERPVGEAVSFALIAERFLHHGDINSAQRAVGRAFQLEPDDAFVQYQAGQVAKHSGDFSRAETHFRACSVNQHSPAAPWISDDCAAELLPASRAITMGIGSN